MRRIAGALVLCVTVATYASALSFQFEKQKLKLSYEYENYISLSSDTLNPSEVLTPGLKVTYLMKGHADAGKNLLFNFDVQTGLKGNLFTEFVGGDLSRFIWTNRLSASAIVPINKFYVGSSLYFRNKWLSEVPPGLRFIDIFGGEGYNELTGGLQMGYAPSSRWEVSGAVQTSNLKYQHFTLSDSHWKGASIRVGRKIQDVKINAGYRYRSIDYDRPVITPLPDFTIINGSDLQHDRFWEVGGNIEFFHSFYFSGGFYYQRNNSNSLSFSYSNHRISVLIGTDLRHDLHLQAYGVLTRQDYLTETAPLDLPLLLDESENTMAASLIKTLNGSSEIEFGFQRFTNYSSFRTLNASKNILYAAYNFRF